MSYEMAVAAVREIDCDDALRLVQFILTRANDGAYGEQLSGKQMQQLLAADTLVERVRRPRADDLPLV